jgi:aflatoxin B1 aldehyde reductase
MHNKTNIKLTLDQSLAELSTDSVYIFYLHAPDRSVPFEETLEASNELHKEGKFKD